MGLVAHGAAAATCDETQPVNAANCTPIQTTIAASGSQVVNDLFCGGAATATCGNFTSATATGTCNVAWADGVPSTDTSGTQIVNDGAKGIYASGTANQILTNLSNSCPTVCFK